MALPLAHCVSSQALPGRLAPTASAVRPSAPSRSHRRVGAQLVRRYAIAVPVSKRPCRRATRVAAAGVSQEDTELLKSVQLLLKEVRVLGMPDGQVEQYLLNSQNKPFEGFDNARAVASVKDVMKGKETASDPEALAFAAAELRDLWMWKRRKGDYFGGDGQEMYEIALSDIQDVEKKAREAADSEKISSILLDDLDMSDEDKSALGDAITGIAVGGIQTAIWNAVALFVIAVTLLNFAGRGG